MKTPYRVKIKLETILELEVNAENEEDAEALALEGYERFKTETVLDKEVLEIERIEHD